jgi:hypothetical protein
MPQGLSTSRLINVSLSLSAALAGFANLNSTLILGESTVIDPVSRIMSFNSLSAVAQAFPQVGGAWPPEYLAAQAFFSQLPQPNLLYIGRWAQQASAGRCLGAPLTSAEQAMSNFTGVVNGGFHVAMNGGAAVNVTGVNLATAANLNAVAALIQAAMQSGLAGSTCTWNGQQFVLKSGTSGPASSMSVTTAPTAGTDLGPLLNTNAASGGQSISGIAAETALQAVQACDQQATYWYALNTDACPHLAVADVEAIAAYIEAATQTAAPHIYGLTTNDPNALNAAVGTDVGTVLHNSGYQRTFVQWSSNPPNFSSTFGSAWAACSFAACSLIALFATVNLRGANTMITAAYKQEPGITPEQLTATQANALDASGYNYYAVFNNGVPVVVNGCMICTSITPGSGANEIFVDEIFGADGLCNSIQVDYFNLLAGVPKLPQTDGGNHQGANAIEAACAQYVTNGYIGPGQWNAGGFGQITNGSYLSKGYYVYTPPIISQAQADRAARKSVPYQVAAKTAGAVHTANIAVTVNP